MKKRMFAFAVALTILISAVPGAFAAGTTVEFTGVPPTHMHRAAIDYCVANGFFKGTSSTMFAPDAPITREQLAIVWARTFQASVPKFTDATRPKDEADNAIILTGTLGFIRGINETTFGRTGNATREQVITIAARTYLKGVDGGSSELGYTDASKISAYAKDGVAACKSRGVLDGVFTGTALNPQQNITRGEVAHIIYNVMREEHTVTVTQSAGGTLSVSRTKARVGDIITVTALADSGKQLKAGSIKVNGTAITGTTFTMPATDVTVTAVFEDKTPAALKSIAVTTEPTDTEYTVGDTFKTAGMVVTATYTDDTTAPVTGYTTLPLNGVPLDTAGDVTVTVSYTEGGITKTATFTVTVNAAGATFYRLTGSNR